MQLVGREIGSRGGPLDRYRIAAQLATSRKIYKVRFLEQLSHNRRFTL